MATLGFCLHRNAKVTARVTALNEIFKQFPSTEPSWNDGGCNYLEKPPPTRELKHSINHGAMKWWFGKIARASFIESASFLLLFKEGFEVRWRKGVFDTCGVCDNWHVLWIEGMAFF